MFGIGGPELIIIFGFLFIVVLPFIINAKLAASRGKSVALMLLLTIFFSWIITLILAFLPAKEQQRS